MLINEVCKKCSLTKKAIEYYEKQGLVYPEIGENGYRNYSAEDILVLKEISVLRKLGLSISDIKQVLKSSNKSLTLSKLTYLQELKLEKETVRQKSLEQLIQEYDLDKVMDYMDLYLSPSLTIKEKLALSLPGSLGVYLSVHFGQFLNEAMDSDEQKDAYGKIIHFLDNLNLTKETEEYLEFIFPILTRDSIEGIDDTVLQALGDIEIYLQENKKSLETYMHYRTSAEYTSSTAYKIQQIIFEIQKANRYQEVFVENLKVLSSSYREYSEKLQKANQILLERYPEMARIKPARV